MPSRVLAAALCFASVLAPIAALGQSSPGLSYGQVLTAGQLNSYFAKKQDVLTFTPLNQSGGTMGGKLSTAASTINGAGFSIAPGIAPTSPSNGDLWATGVGLFGQFNNATMQFAPIGSPTFTGTVTTPTLAISSTGSTGDVSGMSVTAGGVTSTLATRFPLLAPLASPTFTGTVTIPTLALTALFTPAQYTVATLPACAAGTKGALAVATDISAAPTYRQTGLAGAGTIAAPVFCNGTAWEAH